MKIKTYIESRLFTVTNKQSDFNQNIFLANLSLSLSVSINSKQLKQARISRKYPQEREKYSFMQSNNSLGLWFDFWNGIHVPGIVWIIERNGGAWKALTIFQ